MESRLPGDPLTYRLIAHNVQPRVHDVTISNEMLSIALEDGRVVFAPLKWYPRLLDATDAERNDWRVFEDSDGRDIIFWESLDELIPAIALIDGTPSRESQRSLERWRAARRITNF